MVLLILLPILLLSFFVFFLFSFSSSCAPARDYGSVMSLVDEAMKHCAFFSDRVSQLARLMGRPGFVADARAAAGTSVDSVDAREPQQFYQRQAEELDVM
jgi:hypothetical protein